MKRQKISWNDKKVLQKWQKITYMPQKKHRGISLIDIDEIEPSSVEIGSCFKQREQPLVSAQTFQQNGNRDSYDQLKS